ncbi:NAD(P)-dependent oxidoreductase [Cupriavidus plantarum]|uniref:NAD(P)-dependent oxidoreductase n=1 Tax=Cupriavidus plantarum TaxID=942865 RepID=UPI000EB1A144|nr:NAD(P)-dependent oxidoreductase [Cupriavidus plantarum]NYI02463.1 3-hydroxyisobutyrate dehydrogenase [Cupriavidus plantarum]RLK30154.1 3-hydroxyisobutyrate dehydrogenase [Cupriavidus plantarum]CAG2145446.1 2-(hydroxymethyl)glutarate dehydrogenase [Cupriavidus plantarum]SMR86104.1 3-hydroxyisobutyrate dehydrogenase [Cupriavidus plantarum]
MNNTKTVGVIGLGNMGRGMALSLQRAGYTVLGLDKSEQAVGAARQAGIPIGDNLAQLARECATIVLSLPTSAIVRALLEGEDGLLELASPGLVLIDTTTADPQITRELAPALKEKGIRFIDAPVSGGPSGALKGELTMFIGGSEADVAHAQPVLSAMGTKRFHIGDVSAGHVAKLINNLLTASHLVTASEAFRLANAAGISTEQLIEAVNAGSGRSGVTLFNYPSRILNNTYSSGFTMQLMRKDVNLAVSLGEALGLDLPTVEVVGDIWKSSAASLADGEDFNRIVNFERSKSPARV